MSLKRSEALSLYFELEKNTEKFIQAIQEKGFRLIAVGSYKSVYSKNKSSYVIKVATSLNDENSDVPNNIKDFYVKPFFIDDRIVIQKKAKTNTSQLNFKKICSKLGDKVCQHLDITPQNCGSIKGRPVIFDFAEMPC